MIRIWRSYAFSSMRKVRGFTGSFDHKNSYLLQLNAPDKCDIKFCFKQGKKYTQDNLDCKTILKYPQCLKWYININQEHPSDSVCTALKIIYRMLCLFFSTNTSENYVHHADNTGWPEMLKHNSDVNSHELQFRPFYFNYYNKF